MENFVNIVTFYSESTFIIFVLLFFCLFVSLYEYKKFKQIITPFNMMAYPYLVVVLMINTVGISFGFYSVGLLSVLIVISSLCFFVLGGWITEKFIHYKIDPNKIQSSKQQLLLDFQPYVPMFVIFSIISIVASIVNFQLALNEVDGWMMIASKDFEKAYGKGLLSHISQLNRPAFTFLFAYYYLTKKKYVLFLLIFIFISVLASQTKTHIITIILSGFLFSYLLGMVKINFKKILIYCLIIYFLFNLSYTFGYSRIGVQHAYSGKVQEYLSNLFFAYLFGGPIAFSEILSDPAYPIDSTKEMFAVPINIINQFNGIDETIDVIIHNWVPISTRYRYFHSSNVFTLFGMIYMYIGFYLLQIFMFITGIIIFLLRYLALKKNAYIGFKMTYAFVLSFLLLAFFGNLFNHLQIYYTSILMIIFPFINRELLVFYYKIRDNLSKNF